MLSYICFEYGQLSVAQRRRCFNEYILHVLTMDFRHLKYIFFYMSKIVPNGLRYRQDH